MIQHWDGTAWSIVSSPNPGASDSSLDGVAVAAPNDVWAVGAYHLADNVYHTLVEHWDGTAWSIVSSPDPDGIYNTLQGVAAAASHDVWAVAGSYYGTLTEHWGIGDCSTPTPTQTACAISFEDVPPGSTFWVYVERVYAHRVVTGYNTIPPCITGMTPCYLPGNNTTRGQMSKFVSAAFFPACTPYNCASNSNAAHPGSSKDIPGVPETPFEPTPTPTPTPANPTPTSPISTPSPTGEVPSPIPTWPMPVPTGPAPTAYAP